MWGTAKFLLPRWSLSFQALIYSVTVEQYLFHSVGRQHHADGAEGRDYAVRANAIDELLQTLAAHTSEDVWYPACAALNNIAKDKGAYPALISVFYLPHENALHTD